MSQQSKFNGASSRSKRLLDLALKQQKEDPHPPPKRTKSLPKKEIHDTRSNYLSLYDSGKWDALDMILNSDKRQNIGPPNFKDQPKGSILRPFKEYHYCITNTPPLNLKDPRSDLMQTKPPVFTEDTPPVFTEDTLPGFTEDTPPGFTEDIRPDLTENTPPGATEDTPPGFTEDIRPDITEDTPPGATEDTPPGFTEDTPPVSTEDIRSDITEDTPPGATEDTPPGFIEDTLPGFTENTPPVFTEDIRPEITEDTPPGFTEDTPPGFTEDTSPGFTEDTPPVFTQDTPLGFTNYIPPGVTEDTIPGVTEDTPPVFTEDTPPVFTEDTPPGITEDTIPGATEDTPPGFTEDTLPVFTEDTFPGIREDIPPGSTEDTSPGVIEDTPPVFIEDTLPGFTEYTPPGVTEDTLSDFKKDSPSDIFGDPNSNLIEDLPLNSYLFVAPPDSNSQTVNDFSTTSPLEIICDPDFIFLTPESISSATENEVTPSSNSKLENGSKCTSKTQNGLQCSRRSLFNTSNTQTNKTSKKRIRREDRRNYCVFCEKLVLNFRRHTINNHKNEFIIAEYIAFFETAPKESKEKRNKMLESLRLKGNHLYNQSVLHQSPAVNVDQILPVKRPPTGKIVTSSDFVTCTLCHGLFLRKHFYQHANLCKRTTEEKTLSTQHEDPVNNDIECDDFLTPQDQFIMNRRKSTFLKEYGLAYCPKSKETTPLLEENIFKILNQDTIGLKAMRDSLLVDVVTDYYCSHKAFKDRNQVTRKLRDGAKLVHEINTLDNEVKELKDLFNPNKINVVIEACKKMCNLDDQNLNYENCIKKNVIVGMNGRLSWVLEEGGKRLVDNIICDFSLTDKEKEIKKRNVINFQECLRRRWKYCISTNIEIARRRLKIFKDTIMPLDEDIVKFASMLRQMEVEYQFKLQKEVTIESYEMLCKVTICHILTLNRRRPFEATHSDISFYLEKKDNRDYYSPDVLKSFADEEKVSMNELKSYVVPAKGNEEIATILLTKSMEKSIDTIISCRKYLQLDNNKYLFARPGLKTPFDGSAVMREIKLLCPTLKKPHHLTATGLRHHVATVGHVKGPIFSSKLSKFMCHTQSVHDKNYVAPLSIVHRGVIGNYLAGLEGTSLNDHQHQTVMKDITNAKSTLQQTSLEHHNTPYTNTTTEEEEIDDPSFIPEEENSSEDENCFISEAGKKGVNIFKKENKTRSGVVNATKEKKKRWSEEDKQLVVQYFGNFIKKGKNPGTIKCREFLEKSNMLPGRTPAQVNTFIDNVNKNKLKLSQSILNVLKT